MLKNAIPFLLVLVGGLWLYDSCIYRKAMSRKEDNEFGKINRVMGHDLDAQVTIWGPSTAWVQFDATLIGQRTGYSCYNMGINGTIYCQYKSVLNEFLDYTQKCKYMVFVVSPYELRAEKGFYEFYKFKHHNRESSVISMIKEIQPVYGFKVGYVPFYRIVTYDKYFYQSVFYPENTPLDIYGFAPQNRTSFTEIDSYGEAIIDSSVFENFKETLNRIKSKGITPIIVMPPFEQSGKKEISNLSHFEQTIKSLADQQVKVLSFLHHPICTDRSLFYNMNHLNAKGANQLSNAFADSLNAIIENKSKNAQFRTNE